MKTLPVIGSIKIAILFFMLNVPPVLAQRGAGVDVSHFQGESGISQATWTTVGGRRYVLQLLTNSSASISNGFVDLSPVISIGGTSEGATNYLHVGGATNNGGYYRVRLVP